MKIELFASVFVFEAYLSDGSTDVFMLSWSVAC